MSLDGRTSAIENADVENAVFQSTTVDHLLPKQSQSCLATPPKITVYQQIPNQTHLPKDHPIANDPGPVNPARLIVDEEDEDYYIVSHADFIDEHVHSNAPDDATLLTLFFRPVDDATPHRKYLRCSHDQLLDFKDWFSEQQQHPTIVPARNPPLDVDSIPALTSDDKTICHSQLASTFRAWSSSEQRLAAMTLYCAANSIGDLAIPELIAAIKIGMRITSRTADFVYDNDQFANVVELCINSLSSIVAQNSGKLVFKSDAMKTFIRQVDLPNLHAGHTTMTRICFEQIKQLGAALMIHPWYRFRSWFNSMSEWPLVGYVVRNWFMHYRLTADRADIHSEVYHLLREALLVQIPSHPSVHLERRVVDAGYGISQIYRLPGLEAVLRNMGARTALATNPVLGKIPQWKLVNWKEISHEELEVYDDDIDDFVVVRYRESVTDLDTITDGMEQLHTFGTPAATSDACVDQDDKEESNTKEQDCGSAFGVENGGDESNTEMVDEV